MKTERFFIVIGRINSVLLLLVLLAAAVAVGDFALPIFRERGDAAPVAEVEPGAKQPIFLNIAGVEAITGAGTLMMRLSTRGEPAQYSSGEDHGETRNVLFLTEAANTSRWLFKSHDNVVLVADQLRDATAVEKEGGKTKALYFEYLSKERDGGGTPSTTAMSTIGLARPDGSAMTAVLRDVDRVLSHDLYSSGDLSVVYQKGRTVRNARFSLAAFTLVSDQEIVGMPAVR